MSIEKNNPSVTIVQCRAKPYLLDIRIVGAQSDNASSGFVSAGNKYIAVMKNG